MVLDPRTLKPVASETVKVDAPCARCGVNLKGLAVWTRCHQCGLEVARSIEPGATTAPTTAPPAVDEDGRPVRPTQTPWVESNALRPRPLLYYQDLNRIDKVQLARASTLLSVGAVLIAAPMLVAWLILYFRSQTWLPIPLSAADGVAAVCAGLAGLPGVAMWVAGQAMLTPGLPRTPTTKEEAIAIGRTLPGMMVEKSATWPLLVRIAPALWAWPLLCVVASAVTDIPRVGQLGAVGAFVALAGHFITCVHLREVALVMRDDLAARRFRESGPLLFALGVVQLILLTPPDAFTEEIGAVTQFTHGLFGVLSTMLFFAAIVWPVSRFMVGLFSLAAACRESVTDDIVTTQREAEKRAKVRRMFEEAQARRRAGEEV